MTPQQIFNKVVKHLRKQNAPAQILKSDGDIFCAYRAKNGMKCAAGCLIHDDEYKPFMENMKFSELIELPRISESLVERLKPHVRLITSLQRAHDSCDPVDWERQFRDVALNYSLTYTPPTKIKRSKKRS